MICDKSYLGDCASYPRFCRRTGGAGTLRVDWLIHVETAVGDVDGGGGVQGESLSDVDGHGQAAADGL